MKARIVLDGHGHGEVYLDDVRQERVIDLKLESSAGGLNKLTLTFVPDEIEFDGEAKVE